MGCCTGLLLVFAGRGLLHEGQHVIAVGHLSVSEGTGGVFLDSLFVILGALQLCLRRIDVPEMAPLHEGLVGLGVNGAGDGEARPVLGRQLDPNLAHDGACHLALQNQNVLQFALVAVGPEMLLRLRLNQLGGDSHSVTGPQYGSFHHSIHIQLSRNLW